MHVKRSSIVTQSKSRQDALAAVVFAILLCACATDAPEAPSDLLRSIATDSSGVAIIPTHLILPGGARNTFKPTLRIDNAGADESKALVDIANVLLTESNIVVAEASTRSIHFFDLRGRWQRTVGRRGDGPGEFQMLSSLTMFAGDSIIVGDLRARRFSIFSASGAFGRSLSMPRSSATLGKWLAPTASTKNGAIFYTATQLNRGATEPRNVRYDADVFSGTPDTIFPVPITRVPNALNHEGPGTEIGEVLFGGRAQFAASDSFLYVVGPESGDVKAFSRDGRLKRIVRLASPRLAIQEDQKAIEKAIRLREMEKQLRGVSPMLINGQRAFFDNMPFPDSFPVVSGLTAEDGGRLLIELFTPPSRKVIPKTYVFIDADGIHQQILQLAPGSRVMAFHHGKIVAVHTDEDGVESVELYDISNFLPSMVRPI